MQWRTRIAAGSAAIMLSALAPALPGAAQQAPAGAADTVTAAAPSQPDTPAAVATGERDLLLGRGWRASTDVAWTTSGDSAGLHVLAADAAQGYAWRTVATLVEPGFDADRWVGNACVTGSGRRLAVTYAPRTFSNNGLLFARGAFTALVDLKTGSVTRLPFQATLAYYSPGCGTGEQVVYTQAADEDATRTRLLRVDAATGRQGKALVVAGQLTSAVPVADGIMAADSSRIVHLDGAGRRRTAAVTSGVPFRLVAGRDGLTFLDPQGDHGLVRTLRGGSAKPQTVAAGVLTELDLTRDAQGRAYLTGTAQTRAAGGPAVLGVVKGAQVSTRGEAVLTSTRRRDGDDPRQAVADPTAARPVAVDMTVRATGARLNLAADVTVAKPALKAAAAAAAGSPSDPVEAERTCSVPRNDPRNQAMQPKPRQVEWAVDQAVRNVLTVQRPANWKNLGMPAYTPQGLFQAPPLYGGGAVPAQVLLGVATQESNLWQANGRALPGMTANPLIGNFYGREIYNASAGDDWEIHWDKADCGYGIMQLTDRMRLAGREGNTPEALPYQTQRAVALDFAANVAAGLQKLIEKWNQTRAAGMYVNNGDPKFIENWFFALWAYNSGFYADQGNGSPWGVGWYNNPANPIYPANRTAFLDVTMADAAHPQDWPYQEKVLGFAGHPIELPESPGVTVAAFRPAVWNGGPVLGPANRTNVKPPRHQFCDATNNCVPGGSYTPSAPDVLGQPAGPCAHQNASGQYDLKCWYHRPAVWKPDCTDTCGYELLRFNPGYAYQDDGTSYPPRCDLSGLPAGALVVDDVPYGTASVRPNCASGFAQKGEFSLLFGVDATGHHPSKVDFHQFGSGFDGHFYSAFTRGTARVADAGRMAVWGKWQLSSAQHQWMRVKVFIPATGATTRQARYDIDLGNGQLRHRVLDQKRAADSWADLGVFPFNGVPAVTLSTFTKDGWGTDKIVFDAVAFVPSTAPTAQYVALGDSYSSGEGLAPYQPDTDYDNADGRNVCHRSQTGAYPTQVKLPGHTTTLAQQAAAGTATFAFLACSGALTTDVTDDSYNDPAEPSDLARHTDWGLDAMGYPLNPDRTGDEVAQVDLGHLDPETTLVTLTIGGNDARFAEVLRSCIASVDSCFASGHHLTRDNDVVDPDILQRYEKKLLREMLPEHLLVTYRAVAAKAPNAKILVLGYPQLFNDRFASDPTDCAGLSRLEMLGLNTFADLLNLQIARAVQQVHDEGRDISFVSTTQRWRDTHSHWTCEFATDPWIRGGIVSCESNVGTQTPCPASFHPTVTGQAALADIVNTQLRPRSTVTAIRQRILDYAATRAPDPKWNVTPAQADVIARRCLDLTRIGGVIGDPCLSEPIFVVTTTDAGDAAVNDDLALTEKLPWWVRLNYTSSETREDYVAPRDWYTQRPYRPNHCSDNPRPTNAECDEFPFFSSELGAAFDPYEGYAAEGSTRLLWVDKTPNGTEGSMLNGMYTRCSIPSSLYGYDGALMVLGGPYLVIPVTTGAPPQTHYIC